MKRFMVLLEHNLISASLVGLGMLLVGLVFVAGCSWEGPTAFMGDEGLDQPSLIPSHASAQPQLLSRPHPLGKPADDDDDDKDDDHSASYTNNGNVLYGEKWMDDDGGRLSVGDDVTGENEIRVFEDALDEETLITMRVPIYGEIVVDFDPHGTQFRTSCRVTLSYKNANLTGIDEQNLRAWYWNEEAGVWEDLGGTVDTKQQQVIFYVDHFSRYGLGPSR